MRFMESTRDRVAKEYRDYTRYELAVRRHVILLRIAVALAILLGVLNLVLHFQAESNDCGKRATELGFPAYSDGERHTFHAVIEISRGSKVKHELDKATGPLERIQFLSTVGARAIGLMRMRDEGREDDKLIAVHVDDPAFADYRNHTELPAHVERQIRRFFEDYEALERRSRVSASLGPLRRRGR